MSWERTGSRRVRPPRRGGRTRLLVVALTGLTTLVVAAEPQHVAAAPTTFTVNSVADDGDASLGDGVCSVVGSPAVCTLRAAIEESEANPGHDTIEFAITGPGLGNGVHRITPQSAYPLINDPDGVTIDGYTQPGSVPNTAANGSNAVIKIELQGLGGSGIDGFDLRGSGSLVRGLALFDFRRHVRLFGTGAVGNVVVGNFIGTDAAATFGAPARISNVSGVQLERGARANVIGRATLADRNVISGTADKGIALYNDGTDDNVIRNNVIGLAPDGVSRLANLSHGIDVNTGASGTLIGGSARLEGNVVSGNDRSGVEISHDEFSGARTSGNRVIGNRIGTTADGTQGTLDTRNHEYGVNFEGNESCATTCPPDITGNEATGNVIVGSLVDVHIWKGANDTLVKANRIGVLLNGARPASAAQTEVGVAIQVGAFDNRIELNVIASVQRGIHVRPDSRVSTDGVFATYANTFTRNSIYDIDNGLGIALYGADPLNPGSFIQNPLLAHPLANNNVALPIIASASIDRIAVSTCGGCTVELFVTPAPTCGGACFATYGRGRTYVTTATAPASGALVMRLRTSATDPVVVNEGAEVAVTATDAAANTSEFSLRRTVIAGDLGVSDGIDSVSGLATGQAVAVRCRLVTTC